MNKLIIIIVSASFAVSVVTLAISIRIISESFDSAGRFTLSVTQHKEYLLDTKTGKVWCLNRLSDLESKPVWILMPRIMTLQELHSYIESCEVSPRETSFGPRDYVGELRAEQKKLGVLKEDEYERLVREDALKQYAPAY